MRRNKRKTTFQKIVDSKTFEFRFIKRLLSLAVGLLVGYVYYSISFSQAFQPDEEYYSNIVKWAVLCVCAIGSFISPQCCCIASLCIPTLAAKSGRKVLQAALFTWILAGPVSNIFYHSTEAVRSVTCIAKLQEGQTKYLVHLLTAPIVRGQGLIVNESKSLPDAQHQLENEMNELKKELLSGAFGEKDPGEYLKEQIRQKRSADGVDLASDYTKIQRVEEQPFDQIENEYDTTLEIAITDDMDIAAKLKAERIKMCHEIFDKAYDECCRISDHTWSSCMSKVAIPLFNHIICGILYWVAEGKCSSNLLDIKSRKCDTYDVNNDAVNGNYSIVSNAVFNVDKEFNFGLYWEIPKLQEKAAVITAEEIAHTVQGEYEWRRVAMTITISIGQKLLAVLVLLVLQQSAKYSNKYLTDITFDNFYVTSYFVHKDKQRKRNKKRNLLPLTKLEKKYVMKPMSLTLRASERKSLLVKFVTITLQALVTIILFVFDEVLYFIMDLIAQHGRNDYHITGRHMLQAKVGGNGTISNMMRTVFSGFQDNDHIVNTTGSNRECLPVPKKVDSSYFTLTWIGFAALIGLMLVEGYVLRVRRLICAFFFPKQEKRRIIRLYNDMLRQRKQKVQSVQKAILILALTKTLNQKYGLLESLRIRFPKFGKFIMFFGVGKHRCLICETPESRQNLTRCSNKKCRMLYCDACWIEIDEMCWACNSDKEVEGDSDSTREAITTTRTHMNQSDSSSDEERPLL